jgi:hypothetical protein
MFTYLTFHCYVKLASIVMLQILSLDNLAFKILTTWCPFMFHYKEKGKRNNFRFEKSKKGKICYMTLLFSSVCRNTPLIYAFDKYHYNFVSGSPEHTALPKT